MKNLQTIVFRKVILYAPNIQHKNELEEHLKTNPDIDYISDACEYREKYGEKRSWVFCDALSYVLNDTGNMITVKYSAGGSSIIHTIITNDTYYIDE